MFKRKRMWVTVNVAMDMEVSVELDDDGNVKSTRIMDHPSDLDMVGEDALDYDGEHVEAQILEKLREGEA